MGSRPAVSRWSAGGQKLVAGGQWLVRRWLMGSWPVVSRWLEGGQQ